jgi:hypothetical protein
MTVIPKKSFPIPAEGNIQYEIKTDQNNLNTKILASQDNRIGDVVVFDQIKNGDFSLPKIDFKGDVQGNERTVQLQKESLPHKAMWNRVEEEQNISVISADNEIEKANYKDSKGVVSIDLKKHSDFLQKFKNPFLGATEIISQNIGAAIFGENKMAAMFEEITLTPLVHEDNFDVNSTLEAKFLVEPQDWKGRKWNVVILVKNETGPAFSLEMKCTTTSQEILERSLKTRKEGQNEVLENTRAGVDNAIAFLHNQRNRNQIESLLEEMPSREEMKKGLEELFTAGIAKKLNESNPEKGVFFDTLELDFNGKVSHGNFIQNHFVKGFAIEREKIFRKTGEGTGKPYDWDSIDEYVRQTITWDPEENMIVSASRMAVPLETIEKPTFFKGLYKTNEIFEKNILEQSAELGRTFMNVDFLRSLGNNRAKLIEAGKSLFSGVWQQFNALLEEGHTLKYLHGGVSIDSRYSEQSLCRYAALYTHFFPAQNMINVASKVQPSSKAKPVFSTLEEFKEEGWIVPDNFSKSEKKLKQFLSEEVAKSKAKHPELLGRYPSFVGNKVGGCAYFSPVLNPNRQNCLEIGLLLDVSAIPFKIEQTYSPQGKELSEKATIADRVKFFE